MLMVIESTVVANTSVSPLPFISIPYNMYHVYAHGGGYGVHHELLCCVVMVDDIIYRGISPVGNLNKQDPRGIGVIISLVLQMT